MLDIELLYDLGLFIVPAALLVVATQKLRVPSIVIYILVGLAIGPITGLVEVTHTVEVIAEVGIALLLFLVGLELSIDKIKDVGPVAVAAGIGQVVFTAAGGFGLAYLLDFTVVEALFIAVALTFSSTVVVVKLLEVKKDINALYGRIAVGIFLVQDLVVIVALTFIAGLDGSEDITLAGTLPDLGLAFLGMAGLLIAALAASRYALPTVMGWISRSPEALFIWSLFWCFLLVYGAEAMELSVEIGAFLAGIALAQLPFNYDLRRRVHPLVNIFIAIFFVSLGVQMELGQAVQYLDSALILSLFVLIGNPFIFMVIITYMGYGKKVSFLTSVTVAQISEFSFIFAAMGLSAGLIDEGILSLIALVGLVTISISAYMILFNNELYAWVDRRGWLNLFTSGTVEENALMKEAHGAILTGHIIVVGMNALGIRVVEHLYAADETVLAVDYDPGKLKDLTCRTMQGDALQFGTMETANLSDAKLLISALHIEDANNFLAYRAKEVGVPAAIHGFNEHNIRTLKALNVDNIIYSERAGLKRLRDEVRAHDRVAVRSEA
ncbi:MAG: portal protein [Bacteroidetes bacterium]|jgi:Kef-type K+ transport system membrane component KefB|nr:portal protein [Bacteroidota bacterium]